MGDATFDEEAYQREQGQGLQRRSRGALVIAGLIHGANLATGDAAMVGWTRALLFRLLALSACVTGLVVLREKRPRWALERLLGPLWVVQLGVLAAMQWLSPRETVYPWSGAIVFGSLLLTLGSGFSPRWSALILAVGLTLPTVVLLGRLGSASDMPVHAMVAVAVVASARGRERLARAEFSARSELIRMQEERLRAQRAGFVEELHDGAAAGIARAASLLDRASRSGDPVALQAARAELDAALGEARSLMNDLHEPATRWTDLAADLRRELLEAAERADLQASFETEGVDDGPVDEPLAHTLRRVVREASTNVLRHAAASVLRVRLRRRDGSVTLTLEDDGRGVSDQAPRGRGLAILEARVRRLGGDVSLAPREEGGTLLQVTLPSAPVATP